MLSPSELKEAQKRLVKGLLDMIILSYLEKGPTHRYGVITKIKKDFEVYFGSSKIYPLLEKMEKKGLVRSQLGKGDKGNTEKIYEITKEGLDILGSCWLYLEPVLRKPESNDVDMQMIPLEDVVASE